MTRKPLVRLDAGPQVFARTTGVFVGTMYYVPNNDGFAEQLAYGNEVLGLECAAAPP